MTTQTEFRPCGECVACCNGQLIGDSFGNQFGKGRKCIFLVEKKCTIYDTRPQTCRNYQCAWSQHLLHPDMRPDKCGLMVSVETDTATNKQYLKAIELHENVPYQSFKMVEQAAQKLNTTWVRIGYINEQQKKYNIHHKRGCGTGNCGSPCT